MMKHCIRAASFLALLFALLLVFQNISGSQQSLPFDTTENFEIGLPKDDALVQELNDLVAQHGGTLVKVVPNPDNYRNEKDVIWFGNTEPSGKNVRLDGTSIDWLEPSLSGKLIHSDEIGLRPLYGTYALGGSEEFRTALISWADGHDFQMGFPKHRSPVLMFAYELIQIGTGNAVLTSFLLFLTVLVIWFVSQAKARAIRYLSGVSRNRIHAEDTMTIALLALQGWCAACAVFLIYIAAISGAAQIPLLLLPMLFAVLILAAVSIAFALLFSVIVAPKAAHLTRREIPLKRFRLLGSAALLGSVILALLIVPSTLSSAKIYKELSSDYSLWERMSSYVRITLNEVDLLESELLPDAEQFFSDMSAQDNMCFSLVFDEAIEIEDELGEYDHLIIADRAWIKALGFDEKTLSNEEVRLSEIPFDSIHPQLKEFLKAQMELSTRTGEAQQDGMRYYEISGGKLPALPPAFGYGNPTVQAENPLVILVDDPVRTMKAKGFLLPLASTGNIVFKDETKLRDALLMSPISKTVASIESFTDAALGSAQEFGQSALYYIAACILALISMGFAGVMNARLWAGTNKKRIFTLRTNGVPYSKIVQPAFKKDFSAIIIAVVIGFIASYFFKRENIVYHIGTALAVTALYGLANYAGYHTFVQTMFRKIATRKE